MSPVFEGDLQMIQRLFFAIFSFTRRARNTEIETKAMMLIDKKKGKLSPS